MADYGQHVAYKRNPDNSFTKSGEFAAAAATVQLQIDEGRAFGEYTLEEATTIIETAFSKGQAKHDVYRIIAMPESNSNRVAAAEQDKKAKKVAAKLDKEKVTTPAEPKPEGEVRKTKGRKSTLDGEKIAAMYTAGVSVGAIRRELGCSYMGARLSLQRSGLIPIK